MRVTNVERTRWGNYSDRIDSFDDSTDIEKFIGLVKETKTYDTIFVPFLEKTLSHFAHISLVNTVLTLLW
jgi:hypothetical protein